MNETGRPSPVWRKSSHSNGQANCVEVAGVWRKSSHSNGQAACVEVATTGSKEGSRRLIAVRDSKDPAGPKLIFTSAEWEAFTAGVRGGEFNA